MTMMLAALVFLFDDGWMVVRIFVGVDVLVVRIGDLVS